MKKCGFTLAETLLTLAIIGVCAAMLITTIKNLNPNEKSNIVMARKIVGNFTETTKQVLLFNSTTRKMDGLGCSDASCVTDLYAKYLQVTKKMTTNSTALGGGDCSPVTEMVDGSLFCIKYDKNCKLNEGETVQILPPDEGITTEVIVSGACAMIYYDVNGTEKPNTVGKDRFVIPVRKSGVRIGAAAAKVNDADDDDGPGGLF